MVIKAHCVAKPKQPRKTTMAGKNYVDTKELEQLWCRWKKDNSEDTWQLFNSKLYTICTGVTTHFHIKDPEIREEFTNTSFAALIEKIRNGKLNYTPGKAPVFNLLTTTIFRIGYSHMNRQKRQKENHQKYIQKLKQENPELRMAYKEEDIN